MEWLSIDPSLAGETLGWTPRLGPRETIGWTARWYDEHRRRAPAAALCLEQIKQYETILTA